MNEGVVRGALLYQSTVILTYQWRLKGVAELAYALPYLISVNPFISEVILIHVDIPSIHSLCQQAVNGWDSYMLEYHPLLQLGSYFIPIRQVHVLQLNLI